MFIVFVLLFWMVLKGSLKCFFEFLKVFGGFTVCLMDLCWFVYMFYGVRIGFYRYLIACLTVCIVTFVFLLRIVQLSVCLMMRLCLLMFIKTNKNQKTYENYKYPLKKLITGYKPKNIYEIKDNILKKYKPFTPAECLFCLFLFCFCLTVCLSVCMHVCMFVCLLVWLFFGLYSFSLVFIVF